MTATTEGAARMASTIFTDAEACALMVEFMEKAWRQSRDPFALVEAINMCRTWRQPLPKWLAEAATKTIIKRMSPNDVRRHRERLRHYVRWNLVTELRAKGMTLDDACAAAAQRLKKIIPGKAGREDAVKASYRKVQKAGDEGHTEQFLIEVG
jgi:hypothetical protein